MQPARRARAIGHGVMPNADSLAYVQKRRARTATRPRESARTRRRDGCSRSPAGLTRWPSSWS